MRKKLFKKGVGLSEVMVGAVILATAFGGLLATFVSARMWINRSSARLNAAKRARSALSFLHEGVTEATWDQAGNILTPGTYNPVADISYDVYDKSWGREVHMNITYDLN